MTIQEIYQLGIQMGMAADPRGKTFVQRYLRKQKEKYDKLNKDEKKYFDSEYLTNPYSDSRILYAPNPDRPIKKILAGIDCDESELFLAHHLGDIDLVFSHHPQGIALADLHTVMDLQVEMLERAGVPVHIAESLMEGRIAEVSRGILPINDQKTIDIARLLNVPFMNMHTITDNIVTTYIENLVTKNRKKLDTVGDVVEMLMCEPEYQEATCLKSGPKIFLGNASRRPGRIAVTEMTGGTNGAKEMFEQLSRVGVGTLIGMHMREDYKNEAAKYHVNVIIAGHMSSDSIGMNLVLDQLEKRGIEIVPVGGLIRVNRLKRQAVVKRSGHAPHKNSGHGIHKTNRTMKQNRRS